MPEKNQSSDLPHLNELQRYYVKFAAKAMRLYMIDRYGNDNHAHNDDFIMDLLQVRKDQS